MPRSEHTAIHVGDLELTQAPNGQPMTLGQLTGVQILVLLRHRH